MGREVKPIQLARCQGISFIGLFSLCVSQWKHVMLPFLILHSICTIFRNSQLLALQHDYFVYSIVENTHIDPHRIYSIWCKFVSTELSFICASAPSTTTVSSLPIFFSPSSACALVRCPLFGECNFELQISLNIQLTPNGHVEA